jgi:hypothetical protein
MGSYEIVIGKQDGKIQVDGKGFSGLRCLKFLEKLKLGDIIEEKVEVSGPSTLNSHLVSQTIPSEDESKL